MRKCFWAILSVLLLLVSVPVLAQYDTSHHDLRTYDGTSQSCSHCHGRIVTTGVPAQALADAGQVGGLCLGRCHALTGIYLTEPGNLAPTPPGYPSDNGTFAWTNGAADYRAVLMGTGSTVFSHGRDKGLAATNRSGVFPYDAASSTGNLECTSCHSVHDDTNAPFIWRPLFTPPASHPGNSAPVAATTTTGLCDTCHRDKADLGGTTFAGLTYAGRSPGGNHPVDFAVTSGTVARNAAATVNTLQTGRKPRLITIDYVAYGSNRVWDVAAPTVVALRSAKGVSNWPTGGKMGSGTGYATFTSGTSVMGCATCHSAHRTVTAAGLNNLVNVKFEDGTAGYNPICVGCHGGVDVWATDKNTWNVGGSAFGHPVGDNTQRVSAGVPANTNVYTTSYGGFNFNVYNPPATPWQAGANGEIMCSSCHDIHNGVAGSMAIRNLGQTTTAVVCKACHNGVGFPNIADVTAATPGAGETVNAHHRTSAAVAAGQYTPAGEAPITIASPTWNGKYALGQGNIATGMDCADCHVFNGTAHNW